MSVDTNTRLISLSYKKKMLHLNQTIFNDQNTCENNNAPNFINL